MTGMKKAAARRTWGNQPDQQPRFPILDEGTAEGGALCWMSPRVVRVRIE